MATAEQGPVDVREQAFKVSTILENAFDKPRLDAIMMREQIICMPAHPQWLSASSSWTNTNFQPTPPPSSL